MATTLNTAKKLPRSYHDLVAYRPPMVITDRVAYDNAMELMNALTSIPKPSVGQKTYRRTWSVLIRDYEAKHHVDAFEKMTPVDALAFLMEENGMNRSDLGELLGNRSLGSKILRGERELSKAHIKVLADRFRVEPSLFL
ncbi:MAG: hypothetical protein GC159_00380 [Phycisphaera sp.]|nr:hypothetical protein [Phycisphaera sp.]